MGRPFKSALVALAAWVAAAAAYAEIIDAIVATVDSEVILYSDLLDEIRPDLNELRRTAQSDESFQRGAEQLINATLEQAVESKILLREAQLLGIEASDEDVEHRIESLRKLYPSNAEFLKELEEAGETLRDFRVHVRKKILAQKMAIGKLKALEREVVVSEAEVTQYYENNKDQFERPERVRLRQIFLKCGPEPAERAKVRARLELLREELEAGAEFAELAKAHSQAPGAEDGGIVGWQQRGDLVESLETAAFALPEGGVTPVVETAGGLHLMKVDRREEPGLASLEEMRTELEPLLRSRAAEKRFEKWMGELRKRSRVRIFL